MKAGRSLMVVCTLLRLHLGELKAELVPDGVLPVATTLERLLDVVIKEA